MKVIIFELRYCTSNGVNGLLGMLQIALITLPQNLSSDHTLTRKSFLVEKYNSRNFKSKNFHQSYYKEPRYVLSSLDVLNLHRHMIQGGIFHKQCLVFFLHYYSYQLFRCYLSL